MGLVFLYAGVFFHFFLNESWFFYEKRTGPWHYLVYNYSGVGHGIYIILFYF